MARGKYAAKRNKHNNAKMIVLTLALVLIFGGVIGGTAAWLISAPEPVVNTFTYGDINIELEETDTKLDEDEDPNTNRYEMVPGEKITKDPVITVKAGSEEMWLFVKLEKSKNFDDFMEYTMGGLWTPLSGEDDVFYRHITAEEIAEEDMKIHVIKGDTITVKDVTKEMLNALDRNEDGTPASKTHYPTMKVTAYAVQYAGNATAADAWARMEKDPAEPPANP